MTCHGKNTDGLAAQSSSCSSTWKFIVFIIYSLYKLHCVVSHSSRMNSSITRPATPAVCWSCTAFCSLTRSRRPTVVTVVVRPSSEPTLSAAVGGGGRTGAASGTLRSAGRARGTECSTGARTCSGSLARSASMSCCLCFRSELKGSNDNTMV